MPKRETSSLKGKKAFVTGGSRGIGRAVVMALASQGVDVAIGYLRNDAEAESVARFVRRLGNRAVMIRANLGDETELRQAFIDLRKNFGNLDILVHCASMTVFRPLSETTMTQLTKVANINSHGFIRCAQEASLSMKRGGKIIAISSLGSQRFVSQYGALGVAKASLEASVRYLAVELAHKGIGVNAVSGGPVDTNGLRFIPNYAARKKACLELTPMGRLGSPEDIVRVILFLCHKDSSWICGQTITVDGGLSLRLLPL